MTLTRTKKYKAVSPEKTIRRIKEILREKIGLSVKEKRIQDKSGLFYSSRLIFSNDWIETFYLGTNGKGMTEIYSLASAYGELMERIQNNAIFDYYIDYAKEFYLKKIKYKYPDYYNRLTKDNLILKYKFAPDEIYINSVQEKNNLIDRYILSFDNQKIKDTTKEKPLTVLPYYDVKEDTVVHLPVELLFNNISTSGMCAGNTVKEAILQGISEIFERYAIRLIYQYNLSLPTIPKEYFANNDIYDKIICLEKENGFHIEIKDCSCGKKLPAIGVLITDKDKLRYQFHVGADPSPITALERSLTEIFQGRSEILFLEINVPYQTQLLSDAKLKEKEMNETFVVSTGAYPITIFNSYPSYEFNGFSDLMGMSDDDDFSIYQKIIEDLGYKLYIRDVSFLDFPAYHIFIPGISELYNILSVDHFINTYDMKIKYFEIAHKLDSASSQEILDFLDFLEKDPVNPFVLRFFNSKDILLNGEFNLIKTILCFREKQYDKAQRSIEKCILKAKNTYLKTFYQCIRDYIYAHNIKNKDIDVAVQHLYPASLYNHVHNCLSSEEWLDYLNVCNCFDCNNCKISNGCFFFDILKIAKRIEIEYELNTPSQDRLSETLK